MTPEWAMLLVAGLAACLTWLKSDSQRPSVRTVLQGLALLAGLGGAATGLGVLHVPTEKRRSATPPGGVLAPDPAQKPDAGTPTPVH